MSFIPSLVDLFYPANYTVPMSQERIQKLKEQIAELKKRWPRHSVPPAMLQELDDLEEALAQAIKEEEQNDA